VTRKTTNLITLILALIGVGLTALLTYKHFIPDGGIVCSNKGCGTVLTSAYSKVGPIPTATFGLGMYLAISALCLLRKKHFQTLAPPAEGEESPALPSLKPQNGAIFGISLLGVLTSWTLQYISINTLKSFCPYCFSSALLVTAICVISAKDFFLEDRKMDSEQKLVVGVVSAVAILAFVMYALQASMIISAPPDTQIKPDAGAFLKAILRPGTHIKGDPKAPLTLVEFADLQCESCRKSYPLVEAFVAARPKQFRFAFRHCPLMIHRMGYPAALAAEAAGLQGKFWEFVVYTYSNQEVLELPSFQENDFARFAKEIKLDVPRFQTDMKSSKVKDILTQSFRDNALGEVDSTPTFFVLRGKRSWRFKGAEELFAAVNNTNHAMYKDVDNEATPVN
jgi:protein-disulfide isomerase